MVRVQEPRFFKELARDLVVKPCEVSFGQLAQDPGGLQLALREGLESFDSARAVVAEQEGVSVR